MRQADLPQARDRRSESGGGYGINPGPGNRDYSFVGWQLQRQITDNLTFVAELFHRTAFTTGEP